MSQWLRDQLSVVDQTWNPDFAVQSQLNWARCLNHEVLQEHGSTIQDQTLSCQRLFTGRISSHTSSWPTANAFSAIYHSATFIATLESLSEHSTTGPWTFPSAIVIWYYSIYHAFRSILMTWNGVELDTHSRVINTYNGVRDRLPHPFNMVASRTTGETYDLELPNHHGVSLYDIDKRFESNRIKVQGMLLQYLKGTAAWKSDQVKKRILREHSEFKDFRTLDARALRDKQLPNTINFLNCAYRYRGKANYRDSLYLTYGADDRRFDVSFIDALTNVSKFAFVAALVFASLRLNPSIVRDFLEDIDRNFRGKERTSNRTMFWQELKGSLY